MTLISRSEADLNRFFDAAFPKERAGRVEYVKAVTAKMDHLQDMSLIDMVQFREKIVREVGKNRLVKAQHATSTHPLHYYLWTKDHPAIDITFRIFTLGTIHFLAAAGKAAYEKKAPIYDLVQLMERIDDAEKSKREEVEGIKNKLYGVVLTNTFDPKALAEIVANLKKCSGEIDSTTISLVKNHLHRNANRFLNSPETYTDQEFYAHVLQVYALTDLTGAHLQTLKDTKEIYARAAIWKELPFDDKFELLEVMQPHPKRFAPVLQEILIEVKCCFAWDHFCMQTSEEQQQALTLASIILDIEGLKGRNLLSDAQTNLREYIRSTHFKVCAWDDIQVVGSLKKMCNNLDLIDEFRIAYDTFEIEKLWEEIPLTKRLENTELLVADHIHYVNELERRRKTLVTLLESETKITNRCLEEYEYIIRMLRLFQPVFKQGCELALKAAETELLEALKESVKDQEQRDALSVKARILGVDSGLLDLINESWFYSGWMYVWSGFKLNGQRIEEAVTTDLVQKRYKMREIGIATRIDRVPNAKEREQYQISESHLKVGPPGVPRLEGRANITELMTFLNEADREGLIPDVLRESTSDSSSVSYTKREVVQALSQVLNSLQEARSLNDRLTRVRDVLRVYTVQVKERLKRATRPQDKRDVYIELVDLVCKELGFACFHCEDRKVNAAMMIYNEKILGKLEENGTTQKKVLDWLARKRDALVSGMLQEMVQENINRGFGFLFSDVSSSISRWRYVMRRQLGLGDVPSPAHSIDSGLSESQILDKFKKTYTVDWIVEQAMEEYAKPEGGNPALKIIAMGDFLAARISNFSEIQLDLLDEETNLYLTKEGMAFYLQEIGVFTPIV